MAASSLKRPYGLRSPRSASGRTRSIRSTPSGRSLRASFADQSGRHSQALIARSQPGLRGFTRSNLFRMRQFYETYRGQETVTPLVTQLPWTHNMIILSQSKRPEEREFYLRMAVREKRSKRELARQFKAALFERVVLQPPKVSAVLTQSHPQALSVFKDSYMVEFLGLPDMHSEADLQRGLLEKLKAFLIELGRDVCFVGALWTNGDTLSDAHHVTRECCPFSNASTIAPGHGCRYVATIGQLRQKGEADDLLSRSPPRASGDN
jgi:predicted nuclease of restriction endonuclease-like (RecB) superfamily